MIKAAKLSVIASACLLFVLAGCEEVPITGRKQLNLVPESVINSMSVQQYSQFMSASKLSGDSTKAAMVKRVGEKIVKAVEQYSQEKGIEDRFAGYQWEFNLVEDPNVNAFAMPGGKVVVYTGILPLAQDEAGLATVIGHEIAHVFARHGSERMSHELVVQGLGLTLSEALKNKPEQTKDLYMAAFGMGTQVGYVLPVDRRQENEADRLGLTFMAIAGYDPHEAVSFWQRMAAANEGRAKPLEILSTHPADETRIENIQKLLPEAMQYYKPGQAQAPPAGGTAQALAFSPINR
ncbi:MAG: M48 family metallopeptidase [Sedimentisphaerales bacterium]|nr:M48 family metallopeptidase [Sedimentisphaerales bacterium]